VLSREEEEEIAAELKHYEQRRGACIEALKIVQRRRRWVSDEAVRDIAAFLDMTPEELDNVATFYNLIFRKPVGRHVILLCDSVSCWITGYERLLDRLREQLNIEPGQTTPDDRFTLLQIACLGICDRAPALIIDNDLHVDLTPEKLEGILADYP
jgi:NADH-quinone oxidoreductase subunit E